MISVQDLKRASINEIESLIEDARVKNDMKTLHRLEYSLLIKYCARGVGVPVYCVIIQLVYIIVLSTCVEEHLMQ